MNFETVTLTNHHNVSTIALNRPDKLNALTPQLLGDIRDALSTVAEDSSVRVVILTGAGRAFCAGADLQAGLPSTGTPEEIGAAVDMMLSDYYHPIVEHIVSMPKPVIAAVNGVAAGAGMSLALACDMRVIADSTVFSTAFTGIGLTMDAGGSYFLPRLVGMGRAFELGYSARKVQAEEAVRIGLAELIFPSDSFAESVAGLAAQLAHGATFAYGKLKQSLNASFDNDLSAHLALEASLQGQAAQSADFAEGVAAFVAKRPPVFQGS